MQLKAKLKLKQAESIIRVRNYGTAARNLSKVVLEIKAIKERIKNETAKLESLK